MYLRLEDVKVKKKKSFSVTIILCIDILIFCSTDIEGPTIKQGGDVQSGSKGAWTLWLTPGSEDGMGCNSKLSMVAYGNQGTSAPIPIVNGEEQVQSSEGEEEKMLYPAGVTNKFDVSNHILGFIFII